jgi:hypothetical protein
MGRLSSAERHWKSRLEDQTLLVEERNKAAQEIVKSLPCRPHPASRA